MYSGYDGYDHGYDGYDVTGQPMKHSALVSMRLESDDAFNNSSTTEEMEEIKQGVFALMKPAAMYIYNVSVATLQVRAGRQGIR